MKYLLITFGGGLGALARFIISSIASKYLCSYFPCGTLIVNLLGSFFITFLMSFFLYSGSDPLWRYFLVIGFLGGFTTLSSVTYDTILLLKNGSFGLAFLNLVSNSLFTIISGFLGLLLAKLLFFKEF